MKGQAVSAGRSLRKVRPAGVDDLVEERIGERVVGREQDAGFRGLERCAVNQRNNRAGMGVEAEVFCEGRVADDHAAFRAGLAKTGHRVAEAFGMVGEAEFRAGAQIGKRGALVRGQGCKVAINVVAHSAAFISNPSAILSDGATG
jgi:hypothetical protein